MRFATAIARRDLLTASAGATLDLAFPVPRTQAAKSKAGSVILVNLTGGLSHLDSLDMKPDAPAATTGPTGTRGCSPAAAWWAAA